MLDPALGSFDPLLVEFTVAQPVDMVNVRGLGFHLNLCFNVFLSLFSHFPNSDILALSDKGGLWWVDM